MSSSALTRGASAGAITLALLASTPHDALAQTPLPHINIGGARAVRLGAAPRPTAPVDAPAQPEKLSGATVVDARDIAQERPATADTVRLLENTPGVSWYESGGVSRLPAIHGMADDRLKILVGGVEPTSACSNHMNPPLSYIDPNNVQKIDVYSGVMPVSKGGDSIGGSIIVTPRQPVFAPRVDAAPAIVDSGGPFLLGSPYPPFLPFHGQGFRFGNQNELVATGAISAFFRTNNNGITVSGTANVATEHWSVLYNGAWSRATDYHAGGGEKVLSTNFISEQHSLTAAYQNNGHLFSIRGAVEHIPYQGYPNVRMDMTGNRGYTAEAKYLGAYDWGAVDARAFWHHVTHTMGFLRDKQPSNMPMSTIGHDFGYSIKTEIPFTQLSGRDLLRLGSDYHGFRLKDWWEPVSSSMMMRPFTFWNINNGDRNRVGHYAEWEGNWTPQWSTLLGLRNDVVWMDTGEVTPYDPRARIPMGMMGGGMGGMGGMGMMMFMNNPDAIAAGVFNARNRSRTDVNFDMTAKARYQRDDASAYEFGYSRKTRSPNLYERYAWGVGMMATAMNNWFGDLNGYIGNLDLKPEVAHTIGFTAEWRDPLGNWEARVNPYYSYIENFINAERVSNITGPAGLVFPVLQFRNHKAQIYGFDISGRVKLWEAPEVGQFFASGVVNYAFGRDFEMPQYEACGLSGFNCYLRATAVKGGDGLYHIMPLNARGAIEHRLGGWSNAVELQLVDSKTHVSVARNELKTGGYALLNLRTAYEWGNLRFDLALENVFDQKYYPPLGGHYFTLVKVTNNPLNYGPVPGIGRNFVAGVTAKF